MTSLGITPRGTTLHHITPHHGTSHVHLHVHIHIQIHVHIHVRVRVCLFFLLCVAVDGGVWCGVVWCGVVWCGVVWCGVNGAKVAEQIV